jgi:hypothetical protein
MSISTPLFYRRGIRNFWRLPLPVRRVLVVPIAVLNVLVEAVLSTPDAFRDGMSTAEHTMRSERLLAEMRGEALSPGDPDA